MEFLDTVNEILFWFLAAMLCWQAYILIFHRGVPNIGTAPEVRNEIIAILKKEFEEKKKDGFTICDLGSGSGRLTREIAKHIPGAHVVGYEVSWQSVMWANMRKRWYGLKNVEYRNVDFFKTDMSEADAVTMYLVIDMMEHVGRKLKQDLKPETLVVSNRFKLGAGWTPKETVHVKTLYPHQKELYVYRKDRG